MSLADFNYDGTPEVYVGNEIYDAITGTRLATGGANNIGNNIYTLTRHDAFVVQYYSIIGARLRH